MPISHSKIDQITHGFIKYLEKTGQLSLLPELARQHLRAAKTQLDPNVARIQSSVALTAKQIQDLETTLSQLFHRAIAVHNEVRPGLIAGLFIRIGDKVIDTSLKTKLELLRESLIASAYEYS